MLLELVESVVGGEWPVTQKAIDDFLVRLEFARGEVVPGHTGQAFRLTGDRELAADYLIVHEYDDALVGFHALGVGPAQDVQRVYQQSVAEMTSLHGEPEKAYDRRRPPSEVSHWVLGPARVSIFCHADHNAPNQTIQLAIEHIERSAHADEDVTSKADA
ncbi:hypothetical protein [Ornithinimicrobium faecis]|uniref:Uncharacterized protein n=1 Tax=Ornithinimicrobium faecis TaxID=2934158 RepID=A0ABY4Z0E6_9MICO|nr:MULTISPECIES: hypothetical protein [unclassified Ornithinimicrobium]USQ82083.1 hypothetical protein NF556_10715 [Ornithinimicrobium sp. HY1793]